MVDGEVFRALVLSLFVLGSVGVKIGISLAALQAIAAGRVIIEVVGLFLFQCPSTDSG